MPARASMNAHTDCVLNSRATTFGESGTIDMPTKMTPGKNGAKKVVAKKQSPPKPGSRSASPAKVAAPKGQSIKIKAKPAVKVTSAKADVTKKPVAAKKPAPVAVKAAAPKVQAKPVVTPKAVPAQSTAAAKPMPAKAAAPKGPVPPGALRPAAPATARAMPAAANKQPGQAITATPKAMAEKVAAARQQAAAVAAAAAAAAANKKPVSQRHGFKLNEWIVYPAHGVGRVVAIEEQEIAGMSLELFVITFEKDKMTLRVPTGKSASVGMRKLADEGIVKRAMETLKGRARVKRTMWSRRAQEYEAKINSGDLIAIAEVVRDLYRSESQPEQSYSERQLYEAALDRMAREIAAVEKLDERGAVQRITEVLSKSAKGRRAAAEEAEVKAA